MSQEFDRTNFNRIAQEVAAAIESANVKVADAQDPFDHLTLLWHEISFDGASITVELRASEEYAAPSVLADFAKVIRDRAGGNGRDRPGRPRDLRF